jgi:putative ABC transport system substrate-binding protein
MRRRNFITLLGSAAVGWPLTARAQQAGRLWQIGFVAGADASLIPNLYSGFLEGMRNLGYAEGKDFVMEWRFAEGDYDRFREFAMDMVRLKVDVIVLGTPAAIGPMKQVTSTIPIVMAYSHNPVGNGIVSSLSRPGGNVTGLAGSTDDTAPKQLEWLAAAVPNMSRVGLLVNPNNSSSVSVFTKGQSAARRLGLGVIFVAARNTEELKAAFRALARERAEAVLVAGDAMFFSQRRLIAELALANRLPSIFPQREYAEAGGLMSYGDSLHAFFYRTAYFVDKIFRGVKPADLPVERPTRFRLVINIKTAKALGLDVSSRKLALADEVIE